MPARTQTIYRVTIYDDHGYPVSATFHGPKGAAKQAEDSASKAGWDVLVWPVTIPLNRAGLAEAMNMARDYEHTFTTPKGKDQ